MRKSHVTQKEIEIAHHVEKIVFVKFLSLSEYRKDKKHKRFDIGAHFIEFHLTNTIVQRRKNSIDSFEAQHGRCES